MILLLPNLATMNRKDETSHERSKRILAALQQAITWIQDHPEKAKAIVSDTLNIENNQLDWMWRDYVFRLSMTNVLLANLQLQARWALEHNLVEGKQPDLRSILDRSALQAMQDEVVEQ